MITMHAFGVGPVGTGSRHADHAAAAAADASVNWGSP